MKKLIFILTLLIITFMIGGRDPNMFIDGKTYDDYFNNLEEAHVEESFKYISFLMSLMGFGINGVLTIYAFLGFFIKIYFYKYKVDKSYVLILLYITSYFFIHDLVQIRVGAALGVSLYAIYLQNKNQIVKSIILFFIAFLLHYSIILLAITSVIFYYIKNLNLIIKITSIFFYVSIILFLTILLNSDVLIVIIENIINALAEFNHKINYYNNIENKVTNFRIFFTFILAALSFYYLKYRVEKNYLIDFASFITIFSFMLTVVFKDYSVIASRLADIFLFFYPFVIIGYYKINILFGRFIFMCLFILQISYIVINIKNIIR